MIKSRFRVKPIFVLVLLLGICFQLKAQERKIQIANFELEGNHNRYSRGTLGLLLSFDVGFSWQEESLSARSFDIEYRLEQKGKVLPNLEGTIRKGPRAYSRGRSADENMHVKDLEIFIPYADIPLESGTQNVAVIFSFKNKNGNYPDCAKESIRFKHVKTVIHDVNEQVFDFGELEMDYQGSLFSTKTPALAMKGKVNLKYGPGEIKEDQYDVIWTLRDTDGNMIYQSESQKSSLEKHTTLSPRIVNGKPVANLKASIDYYQLKADGPTPATLEFFVKGANGGPKSIYKKQMTFDFPEKYKFEEQEFTITQVIAAAVKKDGVQGIEIFFQTTPKFTSILRNPEKGDFYFYPLIYDETGKQVILPARAPKIGGSTSHLMDGYFPDFKNKNHSGSLFVPSYMLDLTPGKHALKFALMVSDKNLGTNFPELAKGEFKCEKPAEVTWHLALEYLEMVNAKYDVEFIPVSSRLPELQYAFCVGGDRFFKSDYVKNSLTAVPGATTILCSRGDQMRITLYDVDSGFFNDSDFLGGWELPYPTDGNSFILEKKDEGQVKRMKIVGEKR